MSLLQQQSLGKWSINNSSGERVVEFTSFISMDLRDEYNVVTSPVEEGSFASYNKVATPLEIDCSLGIEWDETTLNLARDPLNELAASTDIVSLVTPETEYYNLNLKSVSYRRKREDGLGVLWLDLKLVEVRQVKAQYTNVKLAERKNRGKVQPKEVPEAKKKSLMKFMYDSGKGVRGGR